MALEDDPEAGNDQARGETQFANKKSAGKKASLVNEEFDLGIPMIENKAFGAILEARDDEFWKRGKGVWIRYHNIPRKSLFTPTGTKDGPDWRNLGLRRVTFCQFGDGTCRAVDDNWNQGGMENLGKLWTGKTVFFESHLAQARKGSFAAIKEKSSDTEAVDRLLVEGCCGKNCLPQAPKTKDACVCENH